VYLTTHRSTSLTVQ